MSLGYCPHCHREIDLPLPVEAVWTYPQIAQIIPVSVNSLRGWVSTHGALLGPPRYIGLPGHQKRVFTSREVKRLHEGLVKPKYVKPALRPSTASEIAP